MQVDLNEDESSDVEVSVNASGSILVQPNGLVSIAVTSDDPASKLQPGDQVDASWFDDSQGSTGYYAYLFDAGDGAGSWADIADHGYVALALYTSDADPQYAWPEVTRGSAILGQAGDATVAGESAAIPASGRPHFEGGHPCVFAGCTT